MCIFVGAVLAETIRLWLRYRLFSAVCHDVSQVMSLRISSVSMWLSVVSPIAVTHKMLVDARCRSVPCVASSSFLGPPGLRTILGSSPFLDYCFFSSLALRRGLEAAVSRSSLGHYVSRQGDSLQSRTVTARQ